MLMADMPLLTEEIREEFEQQHGYKPPPSSQTKSSNYMAYLNEPQPSSSRFDLEEQRLMVDRAIDKLKNEL